MGSSDPTRVLVVTDRDATTPALLDTIRGRAARGPAVFRILVPNPAPAEWNPLHPERHLKVAEAERELATAIPRVEEAAGHAVEGVVSIRHDPMDAIEETLLAEPFDEIILATAPHPIERWLHLDLPHRVAHLGLPVTTVTEQHRNAEAS
ncbi:MAG: hypothetical protein QOI10_1766 [Solirubrobacterales bacterium]|nr:hypothetical protein [Solirubrobacterales bacterium]